MSYRSGPLVLLGCVALLVTPLALAGGRMIHGARAIEREAFEPAMPLEGAYTDEELRAGEGQLARFMPADEFLKGVTRQQVESAAEAARTVERAKKEAWEDGRQERLAVAARRRARGWTLLGLAAVLLGAWGMLAWKVKAVGGVPS